MQRDADQQVAARHAPALAVHNNTLYCVLTGLDGKIYLSSFTGSGWASTIKVSTTWETPSAPALTSHDGRLYIALRATDDSVRLASSADAAAWSSTSIVSDWRTYDASALASFDGKLHLAHRDRDGALHVGALNGSSWSAPMQLQPKGYGAPSHAVNSVGIKSLWAVFV